MREDAVLSDELGRGHVFAQNVVVHPVQGFEVDEVVAIDIPGGFCSETDPDEVHTPWSVALGYVPSRGGEGGRGPRVTAGRAACQIGALSPLRAEANGCPANGQVSDAVEILTATAEVDGGMQALNTFTLRHDRDLNCLYHDEPDNNGEPGTGGRVAIVWPFGYTAIADETGVSVLDAAGTPVAHTDVAFQIGGGAVPADSDYCGAIGVWVANGPPLSR